MALVFRLAKRGTSTPVGWPTLGRTLGLHSVASIVGGAGNAVFAMALVPELQVSDFLYLMAAFGLAGVAGMVAIFAPAGLGVREGVLLVMLAVVMSPAAAIIVAVVGRLFGALMDVMFWSLSEIYSRANTSN